MPPAVVQQKLTAVNPANTSHAYTLTSTPSDNNLLVAVVFWTSAPGTVTPPSGWSLAVNQARGTTQEVSIYYKVASGEGTSWTWTTANSIISAGRLYEASGCSATQASVLDKTASADGGTGAVTSQTSGTTAATTITNELAIAGLSLSGASGGSESVTNSFTIFGTNARGLSADKTLSATGTVETTFAWTTARTACAAVATFKATTTNASAEAASFTLSGQDATTTIAPVVEAASFTVSGQDVQASIAPSAEAATFTIAAQDATVQIAPTVEAALFTLAAQDASVSVAPIVEAAAFTIAAGDVSTGLNVSAGEASFSLSAQDATTQVAPIAEAASFIVTAYNATTTGVEAAVVAPVGGGRKRYEATPSRETLDLWRREGELLRILADDEEALLLMASI